MNDFSYKNYLYLINAIKLIPPIGEWKFFARVTHLYKKSEKVNEEILDHHFGETYGETEEIAQNEMRKRVQRWVDQK